MQSITTKSENKASLINMLLVIASILIAATPELVVSFPKNLWIGICLIWYPIILFEHQKGRFIATSLLCVIVIWLTYEFWLLFCGFSNAAIGNFFIQICFFDMIIKAFYIKQFYSHKQKFYILFFAQIIILLNVISNIAIGNTIEDIHTRIYWNPDVGKGLNIAATEFYNMLSYSIGISTFLVFSDRNRIFRLWNIACIIIPLYFMLNYNSRATSFTLGSILMLIAFIVTRHKFSKKKFSQIALPAFFIGLTLYIFAEDIIALMPERIAVRYSAVSGLEGGDEATLSRFTLISNSLSSFITHPILGIGYHLGEKYYSIVGQHSLITDYLAWYGIIGGIFLLYFFRTVFKKFPIKNKNIATFNYVHDMLWVFFLASILTNSFRPENGISAFVMAACLSYRQQIR